MKENSGLCKLCDCEKVLCKSHIIPKAVFRDAMADDKKHGLNKITDRRVEIGKMAGEYEYLLCRDCEEMLGRYDEYGIKFLRQEVGKKLAEFDGEAVPGDIELLSEVDLEKLRLFIISVLWRASISSREFFSEVTLDHYEITAKRIIKKELDLTEYLFPFIVGKYSGYPAANKIIIKPGPVVIEGINFYNLNMSGFNITVKVDPRPFPQSLTTLWDVLIEKGTVLVYKKDFGSSKEYEDIKRLVLSTAARG
ncbi:hypothetical protein ACSSZE_15075 [Acidithiobacillus caldus]